MVCSIWFDDGLALGGGGNATGDGDAGKEIAGAKLADADGDSAEGDSAVDDDAVTDGVEPSDDVDETEGDEKRPAPNGSWTPAGEADGPGDADPNPLALLPGENDGATLSGPTADAPWKVGANPPLPGETDIAGGCVGKLGGPLKSEFDEIGDNDGPVRPGISTFGGVVVPVSPGGNVGSGERFSERYTPPSTTSNRPKNSTFFKVFMTVLLDESCSTFKSQAPPLTGNFPSPGIDLRHCKRTSCASNRTADCQSVATVQDESAHRLAAVG